VVVFVISDYDASNRAEKRVELSNLDVAFNTENGTKIFEG